MKRCVTAFALALVGLAASSAFAMDRSRPSGRFGRHVTGAHHGHFGRHVIAGDHGFGRRGHHRRFFKEFRAAYLDDGYDDDGGVYIQQNFVGGVPFGSYAAPTAAGLPVMLGIREAKPDQPSFLVLNENAGTAVPSRARNDGPRIVTIDPDTTAAVPAGEEARTGGARIIHLSVPVGR